MRTTTLVEDTETLPDLATATKLFTEMRPAGTENRPVEFVATFLPFRHSVTREPAGAETVIAIRAPTRLTPTISTASDAGAANAATGVSTLGAGTLGAPGATGAGVDGAGVTGAITGCVGSSTRSVP